MISVLHAAALQLAKRGLKVFPCQPGSKLPLGGSNGFKDATSDEARINFWWGKFPNLNVAIATGAVSGIEVIDVDMKNGNDGEATLRKLEEKFGPLPDTVEAVTPDGPGRHLYFRRGERPIGCTQGVLGDGLDTKADGGYVLATPSVHPCGGRYAWSVDSASEFADIPEWIYDVLGPEANGKRKGKTLEHWHSVLTNRIANGTRNGTIASLAGKLFSGNFDPILIHDLMLCVNEARCVPPLSAEEVEGIVISVGSTHYKKIKAAQC